MSRQPMHDLRRRQRRRQKVRKLRDRLGKVTSPQERRRLIAKIQKISYDAPVPEK